jgi:hypothetical protein
VRPTAAATSLTVGGDADATFGAFNGCYTQEGELYVFAQSDARIDKERGLRRRRLRKLWAASCS